MSVFKKMTPIEVCRLNEESGGVILIDVSTPQEFLESHAAIARNIPLDNINIDRLQRERIEPTDRLFVICTNRERAEKACKLLASFGFEHIYCVAGGTRAWARSGLSNCKGQESAS